jgi:hypothetical protein
MERSLLTFWVLVYLALWFLKTRPGNAVARAAFTWIGPRPQTGELWSAYQARWAVYSFGWLCQIALVFSLLWVISKRLAGIDSHPWFLALALGLTLGAGIALLATLGFTVKAAKAHYFGPNPPWIPTPDDNVAA